MSQIPRSRVLCNGAFDKRALEAAVRAIALVAKKTRRDTFVHVQPHAHATARIAKYIAYNIMGDASPTALDEIEFGAHLHDVGKYFIDSSLLSKPSALDKEE